MNKLIINPISKESPCGVDYKYEDSFLAIEQEIDKNSSAAENMITNWNFVFNECETILTKYSKDIKVLSWWIFSLWYKQGFLALLEALQTLNLLINKYEDALFPKSTRAKITVLLALDSFLTNEILNKKKILVNFNKLENLQAVFKTSLKSIQKVFQTKEIFFKKIIDSIELLMNDRKIKKRNSQISISGEINDDINANKVFNSVNKSLISLNKYWHTKEATSLRAIKVTRLLSWHNIDALPKSENHKTEINPPNFDNIESIEKLQAQGKIEEAFILTEELIHYAPFWLDGHIKSYELLNAMDETQNASYVLQTLIAFIKIHKGILDLLYEDMTPFISLKNRDFINKFLPLSLSFDNEEEDPFEIAKEKALSLIRRKKLKESMQVIEQVFRDAQTEELRFNIRLFHAQLAINANETQVAKALLNDLYTQIDDYKIDKWNPVLASQVYALYLENIEQPLLSVQQRELIYSKLCKIDVARALSIS